MIFLFVIMDRSERAKINKLLKSVEPEKVEAVRGMIKNASFDDALTVINAFTGQNKPVLADNGIEEPETVNNALNEPLERVEDTPLNIEDIKQKIVALIDNFCELYGIEDFTKEPQRRFTALCTYIGDNTFKHTKILKSNKKIDNGSVMLSTCDAYDWDKVAQATTIFDNMCNLYNKAFIHDALAGFLGMGINTLTDNAEKLTMRGIDIYKKRELSLASYISDSKTNVTGAIACLNHWHGWNGAGSTHTEKKETIVIYPMLSGNIKPDNLIASTENN